MTPFILCIEDAKIIFISFHMIRMQAPAPWFFAWADTTHHANTSFFPVTSGQSLQSQSIDMLYVLLTCADASPASEVIFRQILPHEFSRLFHDALLVLYIMHYSFSSLSRLRFLRGNRLPFLRFQALYSARDTISAIIHYSPRRCVPEYVFI